MKGSSFSVLCLLTLFSGCCNAGLVPQSSKTVTLSKHPVVIVVSYDGFRYDYLNKAKATPWLNALRASGVSCPYMQPVFPTSTFPNHQSIATGVYSETHGIVYNTFYDPEYNDTLSGYNDDPGFWNYHPEVLPIWILNEMAGDERVSGCLMWPGSSQKYGPEDNLLPTYYYPGYNGSVPWENRVDTVISWITNDTKPANLVFLYFDEPDSRGHAFGPNSPEIVTEVEKADNRTAYLINKLIEFGIYHKVNLILLSDHGMKEVTNQNIIYLESLIDSEDLLEAKYGSTPVLQLVPKLGKEEELYETLTDFSNSYEFTIWKKEELREPFYYTQSRRITDYVVIANPGYAFDDYNRSITEYNERWGLTANDTREYGVHGYRNDAGSMRPFFMAHGPAFRQGFEYAPIKNVDIVPLISTILGIPENPNNGSLDRVEDMINPNFLSKASSSAAILRPLQLLTVATILKSFY